MNHYLLIILITSLGCSNSERIIQHNNDAKFIFHSGNISGLDYILIHKEVNRKRQYTLTIDCNHYITGIGNTIFLKKTVYSSTTKDYSTCFFIKNKSMLSSLSLSENSSNIYEKLSEEEYEVIKNSFLKYPVLTTKYALNADVFKNYLGWLELIKSKP